MPGDRSTNEFLNKMIRGDRPDPPPPSMSVGHAVMNDAMRAAAGRQAEPATDVERPVPGSKPGRLRAGREQPSSDEPPEGMNYLLRDEATAVRRGWKWRD